MPSFKSVATDDDNLAKIKGNHFGFTAARIDDLGASEYTLVTIVADRSGSVATFQSPMEDAIKEIIRACQLSPRADNLMIRLVTFHNNHEEVHGFKLLQDCNVDDYTGCLSPGGMTALYDAAADGIDAANVYGKQLLQEEFSANGIVFVITDGDDNQSKLQAKHVSDALKRTVQDECLESLVSILIAVNIQDPNIAAKLQDFNKVAGFTQYVELKDASQKTLAKLAQFVSKSISSQSQSLGSGGPSRSLTF